MRYVIVSFEHGSVTTVHGPFPTEHHARDYAERNMTGQFYIAPLYAA